MTAGLPAHAQNGDEHEEQSGERDHIRSLERGLQVLSCLSASRAPLGISDVAARTGISRAACRRILLTLERLSYVRCTGGGLYQLQPAILALAHPMRASEYLPDLARRHMEAVADEMLGTISLGVLDENEVVLVGRLSSRSHVSTNLTIGSRVPAYCTALGRVLLGDLPAYRLDTYLATTPRLKLTPRTLVSEKPIRAAVLDAARAGYAVVDGELDPDLGAVAVPLYDWTNRVTAALNVAVVDPRISLQDVLDKNLSILQMVARSISSDLGNERYFQSDSATTPSSIRSLISSVE